jgi:hypothetical protein
LRKSKNCSRKNSEPSPEQHNPEDGNVSIDRSIIAERTTNGLR